MKKKMDFKYFISVHLGLTYREAADIIKCSERQVCRMCNGESPAGYAIRKRLIEIWPGQIDIAKLAMIEKGK